jgi:hypothetical protein
MISQIPNYFDLPRAQDYSSRVQRISEDYTLVVEVFITYIGGKRYTIEFQDVLAIRLPMWWKGANFEVGSEAELLEVARAINDDNLHNFSDKELASQYRLYKIYRHPPQNQVEPMYILAGQASAKEMTRKNKPRTS